MSAGLVELEDVRVGSILRGVSLRAEPGTTTALLGRSGSGKTTLLRTVNGLVLPTGGTVTVNGMRLSDTNLLTLRRQIGYVIQETGLFPHMTIERNVAMPLELIGRPAPLRHDRAHDLLEMVGLDPAQFAQRRPFQLSGGQRQRVGLARALACDPPILLLDEPFGALDPLTRAEMQTFLRALVRKLGRTLLVVTHDLQEALYLADRIVLVEAGQIVANLSAAEFVSSSNEAVQAYVRATRPAEVV